MALSTIDAVSSILCNITVNLISSNTKKQIHYSSTFQNIPKISIRPAIGCFAQFSGDFNGLLVFNLSEGAAMTIYQNYMLNMGFPKNEIANNYTSQDVPEAIGEITNQILGQSLSVVEEKYGLSASQSQPKALALNSPITLVIDQHDCMNRRLSFRVDGYRFYLELAMEPTDLIIFRKAK